MIGIRNPIFLRDWSQRRTRICLVLICVWIISSLYLWSNLKRGWVPHDEGALAQSAERVLMGQLPHRDFVEIYTGGLSEWNALAFRLFGINLASLRIPIFLFSLMWIPAVFLISLKFVQDWIAGIITLLAVAWSLPNYSAAVPSWYNLIFATFGILAILQYLRKPLPIWLFIAGFWGGMSFLAKISAAYYVAAVILFFVFLEQSITHSLPRYHGKKKNSYLMILIPILVSFIVLLAILLHKQLGFSEFVHFMLPGVALTIFILKRELALVYESCSRRFLLFTKLLSPFLLGLVIPIVIFLAPYAHAHALSEFFRGVFVLPEKRIFVTSYRPVADVTLLPAIILILATTIAIYSRGINRRIISILALFLCCWLLFGSFINNMIYVLAWRNFHGIIPIIVLIGVWRLWHYPSLDTPVESSPQTLLMLLLSVMSFCSLIQYPFAAPIYFCYVAPLALLAVTALLSTYDRPPRFLFSTLAAYSLLSALLLFKPPFIYNMGIAFSRDEQTKQITIPRSGGIRVDPQSAEIYEELIRFLHRHAGTGQILAGPDSPQVYFLSGHANPTGILFDFFEEFVGYEERINALLDKSSIKAVVVNLRPEFSVSYLRPFRQAASSHFKNVQRIGPFEVFWRP